MRASRPPDPRELSAGAVLAAIAVAPGTEDDLLLHLVAAPYLKPVQSALEALRKRGLVRVHYHHWKLTRAGEKAVGLE